MPKINASPSVQADIAPSQVMDLAKQNELKALVGLEALQYVRAGDVIGVGTGSTVNYFLKALGANKSLCASLAGAVSSSLATTAQLQALGIEVLSPSSVNTLSVYVDGADEIDPSGYMIKGGGAALTREKIVASMASAFICIADESKWVQTLGKFPLPVEIIPMASVQIMRRFEALGGVATLRTKDGAVVITDNGQHILDVTGLQIVDPPSFESTVNQWAGVVTVGVFAQQKASICLLATPSGVRKITFN